MSDDLTRDEVQFMKNLVLEATAVAARLADDKTELKHDIAMLAQSVQNLNETITETFVRKDDLEDRYPDYEIMYIRMDALEDRLTNSFRNGVRVLLAGFLVVLSVIGTVAWFQADHREDDRVNSDLMACERNNNLRKQIIAIGEANETLIVRLLDLAFENDGEERQILRRRMDDPIELYSQAVHQVRSIDCRSVIPGASLANSTGGN